MLHDLVLHKDFLPSEEPSDYHFTLRVTVENQSDRDQSFGYSLLGSAGMILPSRALPAVARTMAANSMRGFA